MIPALLGEVNSPRPAPISASTTKTPRQELMANRPPPTSGAKIGATPPIIISIANIFAACVPS